MTIVPVILSGGGGTRLWPLSTPIRPKQFLALTDDRTMFQLTLDRVRNADVFAAPIVVANAAHADLVEAQCGNRDADDSCWNHARATLPLPLRLPRLPSIDPKAVLLVMPSDHVITDVAAFHAATQAHYRWSKAGWMVTYGITPDRTRDRLWLYPNGRSELTAGCTRSPALSKSPTARAPQQMLAERQPSLERRHILCFARTSIYRRLPTMRPTMLALRKKAMDSATR